MGCLTAHQRKIFPVKTVPSKNNNANLRGRGREREGGREGEEKVKSQLSHRYSEDWMQYSIVADIELKVTFHD